MTYARACGLLPKHAGSAPAGPIRRWGELVATAIPAGEQTITIADAYGHAALTYKPPPRPGQNPAAVTDEMIYAAIAAVNGPTGA